MTVNTSTAQRQIDFCKTFFPGARKKLLVQGISLLQSSEGEKRIRMELVMPFGDGALVGTPTWIGEAYDHLSKADTVERFTKFEMDLEGMSLLVFSTEDQEKPMQTLVNVQLSDFTMVRKKQGEDEDELTDVTLKFVAKVPSNPKLWAWVYPYHRGSIFVRHENTQADLPIEEAKPDTQMKLGDDGYEAARKDATSKARDAEFAGVRQ
jgi:hypothetical protein